MNIQYWKEGREEGRIFLSFLSSQKSASKKLHEMGKLWLFIISADVWPPLHIILIVNCWYPANLITLHFWPDQTSPFC